MHMALRAGLAVAALVVGMVVAGGTAQAQAWKNFKSASCKCSATFPGAPTEKRQKVPTEQVGDLEAVMYLLETPDKTGAYLMMYNDYPKDKTKNADPQKVLNGARDGAAAKIKGKVLSEKKITINGQPGRELEIEGGALKYYARIVLSNKTRLYQAIVVMQKDKAKPADVRKFLDSFKVDIK
jgi:hypothetical protein